MDYDFDRELNYDCDPEVDCDDDSEVNTGDNSENDYEFDFSHRSFLESIENEIDKFFRELTRQSTYDVKR